MGRHRPVIRLDGDQLRGDLAHAAKLMTGAFEKEVRWPSGIRRPTCSSPTRGRDRSSTWSRQVGARRPASVVDLGCGPGQLTATLAERWPEASIVGLDSSPEMIAKAAAYAGPRLSFVIADLRDWQPVTPVEVILSNAALQWVPGHRDLLPRLVDALVPGGWLAFQVPGNFGEPSHRLLRRLADDQRYAGHLTDVEWPAAFDAATYLDDLARLGCTRGGMGDDLPARAARAAPGVPVDLRYGCPPGAAGATGAGAGGFRRRVPGPARGGVSGSDARHDPALSAGSSWWRTG